MFRDVARNLEDLAQYSQDIRNSWNLRSPCPKKVNDLAEMETHVKGTAREGRGVLSVGMGIREYASWWISGARVLFSVALSISLTLSPRTSPPGGLRGIYGSPELPLLGVRDTGSVLLVPVQRDNSRMFMGNRLKREEMVRWG